MRRLWRACVCAAFLAAFFAAPTRADNVPTLSVSGNLSRPGNSAPIPIVQGRNVCLVALSGASSFYATAQIYNGVFWDTSQAFGVSGVMLTPNTYAGLIDTTSVTSFRVAATSIGVGQTLSYTITCGPNIVTLPIPVSFLPVRMGTKTSVPADGSASVTITYPTPFSTITTQVFVQIENDFSTNPWALFSTTTGYSPTGFTLTVAGGPTGSTVTVDYEAYGV